MPWEREPVGRTIKALLLGIALLLVTPSVSLAADCQFVLGFKSLRDLIGHDIVGECLDNEHYNAIGDSNQHTTGGLLAWRKADNWTAFTDGYRTWVNGPNGLQQRLNTERFEWEADYAPGGGIATPTPAPTPVPIQEPSPLSRPPISDSKLAHAAEVMRSTPSGEAAYQVLSLYKVDVVFGPNHTRGWLFYEPSNNRIVVYGKFHLDPPEVLAAFIARGTSLARWFYEQGEPTTVKQCIDREYLAISALDIWNLEKLGGRGKYSIGNTDAERYERARGGVTYLLSLPLDYEFNDPILCPAVPRIQVASKTTPVPATASSPTPTTAPEVITWPWNRDLTPEDMLHIQLERRGLNRDSAMYLFLRDALRTYAYSAYPMYIVYLDATGGQVRDVGNTENWDSFFAWYLGDSNYRSEVHSAVGKYMRTAEFLGPILTTYLKGEIYGSQRDKSEFLSLIGTARVDEVIVYVDGRQWEGECAGGCQNVRQGLVDLTLNYDIQALERLPNPWKQ